MSENSAQEEPIAKLYLPSKSTLKAFAVGIAITSVFFIPLVNQQKRVIVKYKNWCFGAALFLSGLFITSLVILFNSNVIFLGLIGLGFLIFCPIYLYIVGRKITRVELTAQQRVLFDTSVSGVKFREALKGDEK